MYAPYDVYVHHAAALRRLTAKVVQLGHLCLTQCLKRKVHWVAAAVPAGDREPRGRVTIQSTFRLRCVGVRTQHRCDLRKRALISHQLARLPLSAAGGEES